jgi:hypothetical protein
MHVYVVVSSASLFPFDLLLVPFAMVCGIYGMPFVIPALALVEVRVWHCKYLPARPSETSRQQTAENEAPRVTEKLIWC